MSDMSEVFWGMFITTMVGFLLALGKYCYKSKCSNIEFCCIKITRNVDAEIRVDLESEEEKSSKV